MSTFPSEEEFQEWCFENFTGREFERRIELFYEKLGFQTRGHPKSSDGGVDIQLAYPKTDITQWNLANNPDIILQIKNQQSRKTPASVVQRLAGAAYYLTPDEIRVISTSGYTKDAETHANLINENADFEVELIGPQKLHEEVAENDLFNIFRR